MVEPVVHPVDDEPEDEAQQNQQPDAELTADEKAAMEKTAVYKWLKSNNADKFGPAFFRQGYEEVEDVDNACIDAIVKKQKPGTAQRLKNALADIRKPSLVPPKLPQGATFDLSAPEVKLDDGTTFSVPKTLSVDRSEAAIADPNNLTPEEWMVIARGANLLYGYNMEGDVPEPAETPVLEWCVPDTTDFVRSAVGSGEVTSRLTYSSATASYVSSGFDTETATAGYMFCAASFERSHQEKEARKSEQKTLIQVGMWKYPRAQVYLDKCTVPSRRFIKSVENALEEKDRFTALQKVFEEYGHVIPADILLGGMLCYKQSKEGVASADVQSSQTTIKAGVEVALKKASGSVGVAVGNASESQASREDQAEFTSFTNHGGDSLLCSNPAEWAPTVNDPKNWAAIEMEHMRPTVDLLPPDLKKRVLHVWMTDSPEAIGYPEDCNWSENGGELFRSGGGFACAVRRCSDGARGSVLIASGRREDPDEGEDGVAAGAAYAHIWLKSNHAVECSSICLPVPASGQFKTMFRATYGQPEGRLVFVPSNLDLGPWEKLALTGLETAFTKDQDGFLFASINAVNDGERGAVEAQVGIGGQPGGWITPGSSYVHFYQQPKGDGYINRQSFCVPIPANSPFKVIQKPSWGNPAVCCYWMPQRNPKWKMEPAMPISTDTLQTAPADGFIYGRIWGPDVTIGQIKVYTGTAATARTPAELPYAEAAMHYKVATDTHIQASSLMLPIKAGQPYKAVFNNISNNVAYPAVCAELYWTAIVR